MTLIVGIIDDGIVYMAGDSSLSDGRTIRPAADPKVFRFNELIIGTSGSCIIPDIIDTMDPQIFWAGKNINPRVAVFDFVLAVKAELEKRGLMFSHEGQAAMPDFSNMLIGYRGRLFTVQHDFSLVEYAQQYAVIGANEEIAIGVLISLLEHAEPKPPTEILTTTLEIVSRVSPNIIPPFHVISTLA